MKIFSSPRFLAACSGLVTLAFAVLLFTAFTESGQAHKFRAIDVERINVVEPDGTLRMVISNKAEFPGIIIKGKETPHPDRKTAGTLFFNDEATENGGLIFGGSKDDQGRVSSYGHLSFDQYEQDQVFSIDAGEEDGKRTSELRILDEPDHPISEELAAAARIAKLPKDEQEGEWKKYRAQTPMRSHAFFSGGARMLRCAAAEGCPRTGSYRCESAARWNSNAAISGRKRQGRFTVATASNPSRFAERTQLIQQASEFNAYLRL